LNHDPPVSASGVAGIAGMAIEHYFKKQIIHTN
jgi:hypothetical protein